MLALLEQMITADREEENALDGKMKAIREEMSALGLKLERRSQRQRYLRTWKRPARDPGQEAPGWLLPKEL